MKPLSYRALEILMVVKERCSQYGHWIPKARDLRDYCEELDRFVNIGGLEDSNAIRSLVSRGYVTRKDNDMRKYWLKITEDGIQAIEKARENGTLPQKKPDVWNDN